jgi:hypothetical protein
VSRTATSWRTVPCWIGLAGMLALAACGGGDRPVSARPIEDPGFVATGPYQLHYSAVLTSDLPAEVASAYNITRSGDRALVNLSLLRRDGPGPPRPVAARVEVTARPLTGEPGALEVREIRDPGGVSYVAIARVRDREIVAFEVTADAADGGPRMTARFTREFHTD